MPTIYVWKDTFLMPFDVCLGRPEHPHDWSYQKLKLEVIQHYGGKCFCCGEAHLEFLTLDHSNGDGKKHRAELTKNHVTRFYSALKKAGYPDNVGLRVLCMNCNWAIRFGDVCPHQTQEGREK